MLKYLGAKWHCCLQLSFKGSENKSIWDANDWKIEVLLLFTKSCLTLLDPTDCSPPGSSVLEFPRQEYWSGLPFPFPGDLSHTGIKPDNACPALAGRFFTTEPPGWQVYKYLSYSFHLFCRLYIFTVSNVEYVSWTALNFKIYLGENWHLDNMKLSHLWTWYVTPHVQVFFSVLWQCWKGYTIL